MPRQRRDLMRAPLASAIIVATILASAAAGSTPQYCTGDNCDTPNPAQPFALMRSAHDALRQGIKELEAVVTDAATFFPMWMEFSEALRLHAELEDVNMFELFNKPSIGAGVVNREGLFDEHKRDHELAHEVDLSIMSNDGTLEEKFNIWKEHHLAHLVRLKSPLLL